MAKPQKAKLETPGLRMQWCSVKPREIMARLDDDGEDGAGTLLRCWQTNNFTADEATTWSWYCYRGPHAIGVAHSMEEAKKLAQHGPIPPAAHRGDEIKREEPPVPPAKRRGVAPPAVSAAKPKPVAGARAKIDPAAKITLLAKDNPKKADAARRFGFYRTGQTVAEYTAAIGGDVRKAESDIKWDSKQGWIKLEDT
jgi:hypothetical protein